MFVKMFQNVSAYFKIKTLKMLTYPIRKTFYYTTYSYVAWARFGVDYFLIGIFQSIFLNQSESSKPTFYKY